MKYLSLFSGIGGFECAIQSSYPSAECVGYSEIDPYAVNIYKKHYPSHVNLGDVTKITSVPECDLIVAGFPCTNLSSMANVRGNNKGLQGPKSGLFFDLLRILSNALRQNSNLKFIIENNNSMSTTNKELITEHLQKLCTVYNIVINNASFGVQTRKRIIWTNFEVSPPSESDLVQTWDDVLVPLESIPRKCIFTEKMTNCLNKLSAYRNTKGYTKHIVRLPNDLFRLDYILTTTHKSRWDIQNRSDNMSNQVYPYPVGKSRPVTTGAGGNNAILDRRIDTTGKNMFFIVRYFTITELERLFGLADDYTSGVSDTQRKKVLGNTISVFMVKHVLKFYS